MVRGGPGACRERSKFTEDQTAFGLKQAELGTSVDEVCRKMGISEATFYNWKKKYGGLGPSELRRFRTFNVNDDFNRESLRIEIDTSLPSVRVIRALDELVGMRGGAPKRLRLENDPELISAALHQWTRHYLFVTDSFPNPGGFVPMGRLASTYRSK